MVIRFFRRSEASPPQVQSIDLRPIIAAALANGDGGVSATLSAEVEAFAREVRSQAEISRNAVGTRDQALQAVSPKRPLDAGLFGSGLLADSITATPPLSAGSK